MTLDLNPQRPNHWPECPCERCSYWRTRDAYVARVSRSTDPQTSHEAEDHINKSGSRSKQVAKFLNAVREHEGATSGELAEAVGLTMYEASKRLADLENAGKIRKGEPRVWEGSGRKQSTWWLR